MDTQAIVHEHQNYNTVNLVLETVRDSKTRKVLPFRDVGVVGILRIVLSSKGASSYELCFHQFVLVEVFIAVGFSLN